jgi:outer membrane protein OmpA-like peptidoglycan-associated protein
MGGLDVFYSRMDSVGIWTRPQNMGYPLNSVRDDIGFCTNLSGEKGYISAPRNVGTSSNMVIYEVNMPKKVRPLPTLLVNNSEFSAIKAGGKVIMNNILFDFNESTLVESSKKELDKLANILTESPELNIIISGHTDSIGNADYNQILSMKRAISVSEYLNAKGIEKERMRCKGFGSSAPLLPNNSEENRAKNRRIEIEFY